MKKLVLVDGNAILHRAYHALPPLTAPDGSIVNAVYGFTSVLIKIFNDLKPTHIAVAFDRAAPTFRQELFKSYQAQRPKMEENLSSQVDKVHDLIRAFGISIYETDGFEADDMIGTLCLQVKSLKLKVKPFDKTQGESEKIDQVVIVTGDRDLLQLVDKNTLVYMPVKGLAETKLFGETEAKEKFGVLPAKIPDFKALAGDASDNYPGVAGIGPKTAVDLVAAFGTVEGLYKAIKHNDKRLKNFSERVIAVLTRGAESAEVSKKLATIRTDAPIDFDLERAAVATLNTPLARQKLEEFHFPSLIKRLNKLTSTTPVEKNHDQLSLV